MVSFLNIQLKSGEVVRTLASYLPEKAINNTVMVSFTDSSYLESFYASYNISRLDRFSNFIIVAVDLKAYEVLKAKNYPVAYYQSTDLSNEKTEKESLYESKDWKAKMANKIKIIRQAVVLTTSFSSTRTSSSSKTPFRPSSLWTTTT